MKKSADSVSHSRRRHYKLIYTGHRAQCLSTGGQQMWQRCTSQAIIPRPHRRNATTGQRAVRPTTMQRQYIGQRTHQEAGTLFNAALSDLHPDHSTTSSLLRHPASSADARNATHATNGRRHGLNLLGHGSCQTRDASQTPHGLRKSRLRRRTPMHLARTRTSGDSSTLRSASRRSASHHTLKQDAAQRQNHTPPTVTHFAAAPCPLLPKKIPRIG